MNILVIDKFLQGRSGGAESDMYAAMATRHLIEADSNSGSIIRGLNEFDYNILFLGAYHFRMDLDWHQVFFMNTKPVYVCQGDNEEFALQPAIYPKGTTILCRYLPNEAIEDYAARNGYKTALLPWYFNPDKITQEQKTCDVAFICSMKGARPYYAETIREVCAANKWSYVIGEYWGREYYELLAKSRVFIAECDRKCMTLKYIEAALAGCEIIGDGPRYPVNKMIVGEASLWGEESLTYAITRALTRQGETYNREYVLSTHANKEWFLNNFDKVVTI